MNSWIYSIIRENIYEFDLEICLLIKTHLKNNEDIHVTGFNWIGQNRTRSKRRSGWLGFIIKLKLYYVSNYRHL